MVVGEDGVEKFAQAIAAELGHVHQCAGWSPGRTRPFLLTWWTSLATTRG